jgi:undecaprenyl-diphosphatase
VTSSAGSRSATGNIDGRTRLVLAAAVAVALMTAVGTRSDGFVDSVGNPPWMATFAVGMLLVLGSSHFLLSAWSLRVASGQQLALRETAFAQLVAAATNRVVPNGVGGTAVNLRYLLRSGIPAGAAMTALAAIAVLAGATDVLFTAAVTVLGPSMGLPGASHEIGVLTAGGVAAGRQQSWLIAVLIVPVGVVLLVRARGAGLKRMLTGMSDAAGHLRVLARRPERLVATALASTASSVLLAAGFVLSVHVWGGPSALLPSGALVAVYLVGSAAGGTAPVPAFFLLTEVALVTGLVLGGYAWGPAVLAVGVFRLVTYWLPLPAGVWAGRRLRSAKLL